MKLKTRIFITFLVIVLVPLMMGGMVFYVLTQVEVPNMKERHGIEVTYDKLLNGRKMLSSMTQETTDIMHAHAVTQPEKFENKEYLDGLNAGLTEVYSYLIVRKDEEVYYQGSVEDAKEIFNSLPVYGNSLHSETSGIDLEEKSFLVKQVDFQFSDNSNGSAFIITDIDALSPQVQGFYTNMAVIVLLVLVGTSLLLGIWMYRGIIGPLTQLKRAAHNIEEGNLDFSIEGCGIEEFDDLCGDFEEMRKRLKGSTEEQVAFDRENKELISNISHDLKTPITAVKGYVEGIMDGVADTPEKMDKYIRTIYNKANEMDRLINELTFYSKIDTNRIPYTFSKIKISDYFNDCAEDLQVELESSGIALNYANYVDDGVVVIADVEQIRRVINNVVSNSIKYMNKPRKIISMRLTDVGDFIQVAIEDNGKGIANKDISRVFERFYRTDASRNSSKGGSGIGLSIVKKIIEDHGGKVWATSQLGEGTIIHFVLRKYQEVMADE